MLMTVMMMLSSTWAGTQSSITHSHALTGHRQPPSTPSTTSY